MESVVITLRHRGRSVDLEMPADAPLRLLLPPIFDRLGWSSRDDDWTAFAGRISPGGKAVRPQDTLADAGVLTGYSLECQMQPSARPIAAPERVTGEAALQAESGALFPIMSRSILIGRPNPPQPPPDIDLTPLDGGRVTSRRHAQIWRQGEVAYWVKDLHSKNGLFVDGHRLPAGGRQKLREGARLQFGVDGPVLVFRNPLVEV